MNNEVVVDSRCSLKQTTETSTSTPPVFWFMPVVVACLYTDGRPSFTKRACSAAQWAVVSILRLDSVHFPGA